MPPRGGAGAGLGQGKEGYNQGFGGLGRALKMFFGFYPAYRASKLNPIDCLRYE